jgi:hypothetical protein
LEYPFYYGAAVGRQGIVNHVHLRLRFKPAYEPLVWKTLQVLLVVQLPRVIAAVGRTIGKGD